MFERINRFHNPRERARPDSGQKNDHVKSAREKLPRKRQRFGVGFERNFAHRRRNSGLAAMVRNQLRHFRPAPAFERKHAQPSKVLLSTRVFHAHHHAASGGFAAITVGLLEHISKAVSVDGTMTSRETLSGSRCSLCKA